MSIPGGMGGGGDISPPIFQVGGWPVQSSPPIIHHQKKIKRKIDDESPMRVVNGYYSQDDHASIYTFCYLIFIINTYIRSK